MEGYDTNRIEAAEAARGPLIRPLSRDILQAGECELALLVRTETIGVASVLTRKVELDRESDQIRLE